MMHGATKYSKYYDINLETFNEICQKQVRVPCVISTEELSLSRCVMLATLNKVDQKSNVGSVERLDLLNPKECVEPVTKDKELNFLQKLLRKLNITRKSTDQVLISGKKKAKEVRKEMKIQSMLKGVKGQTFLEGFLDMESPKVFTQKNVKKAVKYVEAKKGYTLITTIKLGYSEEYFVVNATRELDCYRKILTILLKQLFIYNVSITNESVPKLFTSGEDNWKRGSPITELTDSLLRHLTALLRGEMDDPESGEPHIGHLQCNAMFIAYMLKNKPEFNDLPKHEEGS